MKRIAHLTNGVITNVSLAEDEAELEPGQMPEAEALAAGYSYASAPPQVKTWPGIETFMAEFTLEEKGAIGLSQDPTIAALRVEVSSWESAVHADDPRVITGLARLVELGIITEARQQGILAHE